MQDAENQPASMVRHMWLKANPVSCVGIFRHYKTGKDYQLIEHGINTLDNSKVAIYKALYGSFQVFVRPWDEFFEVVDGTPRFTKVL